MRSSACVAACVCAVAGLGGSGAATAAAARSASPLAVAFGTPLHGYISLPDGRVLATEDGGGTWRRVGTAPPLRALDAVSSGLLFGLSGRVLLRSRDGGRTWSRLHRFRAEGEVGPGAGAVEFVDRDHGWVSARGGPLYRTVDGGRRWTAAGPSCGRLDLYVGGFSFLDRRHGFAVCGGQPATIMQHRTYLRTSDGGTTWHVVRAGIFDGYVTALAYVSTRVGFQAADRDGIRSVTGGRGALFADDADDVASMSWPSARVGYAVLFHGGLFRTADGGRTWRATGPWGTGRLPPR